MGIKWDGMEGRLCEKGKTLAHSHMGEAVYPPKGFGRFTVFAKWPEQGIEEIDIDARSKDFAMILAMETLRKFYSRGWEIVGVERRTGLYF